MFQQCNVTLMVSDMDRAIQFYTGGLGLALGYRAGNDWAQVQAPGLTIGLHPAREQARTGDRDRRMSLGFQVSNIEQAIAELRQRGVAIPDQIQESAVDRLVEFTDLDGTPLYLIQLQWGH
jgi:predicted enzyme related to lactoylglutathione lyase